ncbi:auxin-responsive protein IAA33 [Magnolia sinica]|uniref:auxin-responsive protein IAA33 n=1 Tax=Magnolia sinica TaxID=86752 RepID=UPI00265A8719|nr:auxin-responsive protein IAA33 [Magnolia sinica]
MNSFTSHQQSFQRSVPSCTTFYRRFLGSMPAVHPSSSSSLPISQRDVLDFSGLDDELAATVIPPVTVVLEGRSIGQRIYLHKHASYKSLARALRQMFVDINNGELGFQSEVDLDLSNAVPGHLVAYEDMEDDLLLAGDLNWKDFVRVAKRIRILPEKAHPRRVHRRP